MTPHLFPLNKQLIEIPFSDSVSLFFLFLLSFCFFSLFFYLNQFPLVLNPSHIIIRLALEFSKFQLKLSFRLLKGIDLLLQQLDCCILIRDSSIFELDLLLMKNLDVLKDFLQLFVL